MVWVNLLPWRQQRVQRSLRRDLILLSIVLMCLFAALLFVSGQHAANVQRLNTINLYQGAVLQAETLQKRAESLRQQKQTLMQQLASVRQRQRQVTQWHQLMQNLAAHMPDSLWLTSMTKTTDELLLAGLCRNMRDLHLFRQRLAALELFQRIETRKISRDEQGHMKFSLMAALQQDGAL